MASTSTEAVTDLLADYNFSDFDNLKSSIERRNRTKKGSFITVWFFINVIIGFTWIVLFLADAYIVVAKPYDPTTWSHDDYFYLTIAGNAVKFSLAPMLLFSSWFFVNAVGLFCYGTWVLKKKSNVKHVSVLLGLMSGLSSTCFFIGLLFHMFEVHATFDWNDLDTKSSTEKYGALSPNIKAAGKFFSVYCFVVSIMYAVLVFTGLRFMNDLTADDAANNPPVLLRSSSRQSRIVHTQSQPSRNPTRGLKIERSQTSKSVREDFVNDSDGGRCIDRSISPRKIRK